MSAVLKAVGRPALDRDGCHWEAHGSVPMLATRPEPGQMPNYVGVHTQRHPRRCAGQAHVVMQAGTGAFSFTGLVSPAEARKLASMLLKAADVADLVVAGRGAP